MSSLFKLVGSIFIDNEEANQSIAKTDEKAKGTASTLASGAKTAAKWGAAITGAAAGVAGAMVGVAKNTASSADQIDKASKRMGVDTTYYQQLSYAAGQCGIDMSTMEKAAKKLEGTDINFDDAMASIMALSTEEERSAAAAELFGESIAYTLSPMLEAGGESVDALMQQASDLGMVMSEDSVAAGAALNDTLDTLTKSFEGIVASVGSAVMPIVQQIAEEVVAFLPTLMELIDQLMPSIISLVEQILPPLLELGEQLFPIIIDLLTTLLPIIVQIISSVLPILIELLGPILQLLSPILDLVMALLEPILKVMDKALKPIITVIKEVIDTAIEPLKTAIETLEEIFGPVFEGIYETISPIFESMEELFGGIVDFITDVFSGDWKSAWDDVVGIFETIWNTVSTIIKKPLNLGIGMINAMIEGVCAGLNYMIKQINKISFEVPDWVPGIGGETFGFDLKKITPPTIDYLAEGGIIDTNKAGQLFVANERGPELVHSYDGKTAVSNNADVLDSIKKAVGDEMAAALKPIEEIVGRILVALPTDIMIDGTSVARMIAPEMDRQLGIYKGNMR